MLGGQVSYIDVDYDVSRKEASLILNLSIRTVDRYIKSGKLSSVRRDGGVFLLRKELVEFLSSRGRVGVSRPVSTVVVGDTGVDKGGVESRRGHDIVNVVESLKTSFNKDFEALDYEKLYRQTKDELDEKQSRLEMANYRVGQLESQLRNSIPMLEYNQERYQKEVEQVKKNKMIQEDRKIIHTLLTKNKSINFTKRVFLFILLVVLAFQPLWLYFVYR